MLASLYKWVTRTELSDLPRATQEARGGRLGETTGADGYPLGSRGGGRPTCWFMWYMRKRRKVGDPLMFLLHFIDEETQSQSTD